MIHCGEHYGGQQVALQDAQGRAFPLLGQQLVSVVLEDKNGRKIVLRDNGLSFLMRSASLSLASAG